MRTLKQWNKRNRRIKKGSKAKGFTTKGKALFTKKQTYKVKVIDWDDDWGVGWHGSTNWDQSEEYDEFMWSSPHAGR